MQLNGIDHVVLYAGDIERTLAFYTEVLGMTHRRFDATYDALHFGEQKINVHRASTPYSPHAHCTAPGGLDLCVTTSERLEVVMAHLERHHVALVDGPCPQTGARGPMTSIYIHDPDGNLIEIAVYDGDAPP